MTLDICKHDTKWVIHKFKDPSGEIGKALSAGMPLEAAKAKYPGAFVETVPVDGNLLLNEGIQEFIDIICGLATPTKFDNLNAYIGVGDGVTAAAATNVGLVGTNKTYAPMDAGYPARSNQTAEWRSTFGSASANHAWKEFTVANGGSDASKNLNRKLDDKGTKVSGESWVVAVQITWS